MNNYRMHLVPFDCNHAEQSYKHFYSQTGSGSIPIFSGSKTQVGYGLGGVFGGLLKAALPIIKKGASSIGKTALKHGINVVKDGLTGKNVKTSLKTNLKAAGNDILAKGLNNVSYIVGGKSVKRKNKRKRQSKTTITSSLPVKRRRLKQKAEPRDIFNA